MHGANNDGFHVNYVGSHAHSATGSDHGRNVLEVLPNNGGYRIDLSVLLARVDEDD